MPLILATVYDVGARYLFNAPTQWAYEVGYMMMGAHALLGMAYTLREGGHIRIDAFSQTFSQTHQGDHRPRRLRRLRAALPALDDLVAVGLLDATPSHRRAVRAVGLEPA